MGKIALIPKFPEINGSGKGEPIDKVYTMEGVEVSGQVNSYAVAPLRILSHVLETKGIQYQATINGDSPWSISELVFDDKNADFIKVALEEIMEYRCAVDLDVSYEEIIRQLPFEVAMRTSDNIMAFGKPKDQQFMDQMYSERRWKALNEIFGYHLDGNFDAEVDNLEIPKDEPVLRKHLIYTSARGGYNIKTKGYADSSLTHYSLFDSKEYD